MLGVNALGAALLAISIPIWTALFTGAARTCTEFERYRTQSEFDDALVLKIFVFELFNQYVEAGS